jgi:hypothetical protein
MKLINVINNSRKSVFVPARGGLSIVLAPGECSKVCPEGRQAQGAFWKMVSRGLIGDPRLRRYAASFQPAATSRTSHSPHAA